MHKRRFGFFDMSISVTWASPSQFILLYLRVAAICMNSIPTRSNRNIPGLLSSGTSEPTYLPTYKVFGMSGNKNPHK